MDKFNVILTDSGNKKGGRPRQTATQEIETISLKLTYK